MSSINIILAIFIFTSCVKSVSVTSDLPDGAIWKQQTIKGDLAPTGFSAIAPWAQTATLSSNQPSSDIAKVEIDYWKIIENLNGNENVIYTEDYNYTDIKTFSINEAGLYCRFPTWFDTSCNDHHDVAFNMSAQNGVMTIDVSQTPSNIVHWWTPRLSCNPLATYSIEIRLKVSGKTAVQFGLDYWRTLTAGYNHWDPTCQTSNNCEAWISDWILPTDDKYVTIKVPKR